MAAERRYQAMKQSVSVVRILWGVGVGVGEQLDGADDAQGLAGG